MAKCERTDSAADRAMPADWDPCRTVTVEQRQGAVLVKRTRCTVCGHETETRTTLPPEQLVDDPHNLFAAKPDPTS